MSLLTLEKYTEKELISLIDRAIEFKGGAKKNYNQEKLLLNVFFEASTRTNYSFEIAARRLGVQTINFHPAYSSLSKGESVRDTIRTFSSFNPDILVIRSSVERFYEKLPQNPPMVNAGDGCHAHPTQSLLDLMTIYEEFGKFAGLNIIICGDIKHSRVARTNYEVMKRLKMKITLAAPDGFKGEYGSYGELDESLESADVVMLLRTQHERHSEEITMEAFNNKYGLNKKRLELMKKKAIIMHPGPFNRGVELTDEVLDDKRCKVFKQTENGVYMRMAVIENELDGLGGSDE